MTFLPAPLKLQTGLKAMMKEKCKNLVRRLFWYGYLNQAEVARVKGTDIPDSVIRLAKLKIRKYR